jgi:predicted DNA-binding protein (MmcQ/YjbR family)
MTIEDLRKICLSFPAVTEDVKWEKDLCFCVGGKMFCVTGLDGPSGICFKCSDEDFIELSERKDISPAPYMARNKWVMTDKINTLSAKELKHYIGASYNLIKEKLTKKQRKELGI